MTVTLILEPSYPVPPIGATMIYNNIVYKILSYSHMTDTIADDTFDYLSITAISLGEYRKSVSLAQIERFRNSKMRNPDGTLKIFHHGTEHNFDQFSADCIQSEPGFWFTTNRCYAAYHGDRLISVYLDIKNPFIHVDYSDPNFSHPYNCFCDAEAINWLVFSYKFRDYLIGLGYDGLVYPMRGSYVAIAFYSEQIEIIN